MVDNLNFPKETTFRDLWIFLALIALVSAAHECEYKEEKKVSQEKLISDYWYPGEDYDSQN